MKFLKIIIFLIFCNESNQVKLIQTCENLFKLLLNFLLFISRKFVLLTAITMQKLINIFTSLSVDILSLITKTKNVMETSKGSKHIPKIQRNISYVEAMTFSFFRVEMVKYSTRDRCNVSDIKTSIIKLSWYNTAIRFFKTIMVTW